MGAALIHADRILTNRQTDRQADRQTDRQTDRQGVFMVKLIGVFCDNENAPKMLNFLGNYNIDLNTFT